MQKKFIQTKFPEKNPKIFANIVSKPNTQTNTASIIHKHKAYYTRAYMLLHHRVIWRARKRYGRRFRKNPFYYNRRGDLFLSLTYVWGT